SGGTDLRGHPPRRRRFYCRRRTDDGRADGVCETGGLGGGAVSGGGGGPGCLKRGQCFSYAFPSTNSLNRSGSSIPVFTSLVMISSAFGTGTARLYGRSDAVSASKMSDMVIIRVCTGISS